MSNTTTVLIVSLLLMVIALLSILVGIALHISEGIDMGWEVIRNA